MQHINPDSIISGHKKTPVQNNNDKFYSLLNNPDKISIQIETETEGSITMYNIFGKQMANFAFHPYETIEIKKSHYSDGIYILEIAALKSKQTEKVIFK